MAHGDAREGKWRGNWRMEWVASTPHTTSEHGASSITTADPHNSAASSRPRRFKWTRPFRRKTKSGFCARAITFQTQSNYQHTQLRTRKNDRHNCVSGCYWTQWQTNRRYVTCVKGHIELLTDWDWLLGGVIAFVLPVDCHVVEITDWTNRKELTGLNQQDWTNRTELTELN